MTWVKQIVLISLFLSIRLATAATEDIDKIMSFQEWKGAQVVEAKNQVARLSNRITLLKKGILKEDELSTEASTAKKELTPERMRAHKEKDLIGKTEVQLKAALENLQFTTELSLQDYFDVYLSRYKDQPDAISAAAERLSKSEVVELLRVMLKVPLEEVPEINNAPSSKSADVTSRSIKAL